MNKKLLFSHLTQKQLTAFQSDCTGMRELLSDNNSFRLSLSLSCKRHDFAYQRGGSWKDRQHADKQFYRDSLQVTKKVVNSIYVYKSCALVFYCAVRLVGWRYFNYGPYKTFEEIMVVNNAKHVKSR